MIAHRDKLMSSQVENIGRVMDEVALLPLDHRLRVHTVALAQLLDRSFRSLYRSSDSVSGRGAAVKYLSHTASLSMAIFSIPSHIGTEHLAFRLVYGFP